MMRFGAAYEHMVVLDADSLMEGARPSSGSLPAPGEEETPDKPRNAGDAAADQLCVRRLLADCAPSSTVKVQRA
jgi:hypothetical protein